MKRKIDVELRGEKVELTVVYEENKSAKDSGFDALLGLPFEADDCIGYPTMHAYFENLKLKGYRRYLGFVQLVEREEFNEKGELTDTVLFIDALPEMLSGGVPYFALGYPPEMYDAPCNNLGDCHELKWTAYTYVADVPSRMNNNKLDFLAGFSWGYVEDVSGVKHLLDFMEISQGKLRQHETFLEKECPDLF